MAQQAILIVAGHLSKHEKLPTKGPWIGVDYGAYVLASLKRRMVLAIGDFDSVKAKQFALVERYSDRIERLQEDKNVTDTEQAMTWALKNGYTAIDLYGAIGGREDHFLANLALLLRFRNPHIHIKNIKHDIAVFPVGTYRIERRHFRYLSFFAMEPSGFSVTGVRFPVQQRPLALGDTYAISNHIEGEQATLVVHRGMLLGIQSDE